jgi:hypothetical protein
MRSDTATRAGPLKAASGKLCTGENQRRMSLSSNRTHEHAPCVVRRATPTQGPRRVANLLGFLLAIVAGTAFNESRQRLDLKSKVPCTMALAVVTRT